MPRNRMIKPEFFASKNMSKVSRDARLLFSGMWCFADDYGVINAKPKWLVANIFEEDDTVNESILSEWLKELENLKKILPFDAENKTWYFITGWKKHQKVANPSKRRNPEPPKDILKRVSEESKENQNNVSIETNESQNSVSFMKHKHKEKEKEKHHHNHDHDIDIDFNDDDVLKKLEILSSWNVYDAKDILKKHGFEKVQWAIKLADSMNADNPGAYFRNVIENHIQTEPYREYQQPEKDLQLRSTAQELPKTEECSPPDKEEMLKNFLAAGNTELAKNYARKHGLNLSDFQQNIAQSGGT